MKPESLTCPCCRAANDSPICRRCKADLSLLLAVERARKAHWVLAQRYAADHRCAEALQELDRAAQLRPGADLLPLRAAIQLLQGDFASAWTMYQQHIG